MEIKQSAYKHGCLSGDILHAWRNPVVIHRFDGYTMYIGSTSTGQLLEVAVNHYGEIFHAMSARKKFLPKKGR